MSMQTNSWYTAIYRVKNYLTVVVKRIYALPLKELTKCTNVISTLHGAYLTIIETELQQLFLLQGTFYYWILDRVPDWLVHFTYRPSTAFWHALTFPCSLAVRNKPYRTTTTNTNYYYVGTVYRVVDQNLTVCTFHNSLREA